MKRVVVGFLLLLLLIGWASASTKVTDQADQFGFSELEQVASEYGVSETVLDVDLDEGLATILRTGNEELFGIVKKAVRSGMLLLVVVLLCGVAEGAYVGCKPDTSLCVPTITGVMAVTAIAVSDANALIGMGKELLLKIEDFVQILVPVMAVVTAANGAPSSAAARQFATMLFSDVLLIVIVNFLIPLVYMLIATSVAYAMIGNEGLKRICGAIKFVVNGVLGTLLVTFVAYLNMTGVIAGSTDALAVKTAKFAMSSMVPVVGGILSDAAETLLAGASILKNAVGVFGLLVVLGMCLIPFLQLGIHYLVYKMTAVLASTVNDGRISGCIDSIGGAFGLMLGMTGASALLLMISIVSAVSMVGL